MGSRKGEGEEIVLYGEEKVLAAVELVGHGGGVELSAGVEMPEGFAAGGIESEKIAGVVGAEEQMACSGQNAGDAFAAAEFVIPDNFAGAVIEGAERGIGPEVDVTAGPAFSLAGRGEIENAEDAAGCDIEKAGLGIEAGRHPIAGAVGARFDERTVRAGSGFGLGDGAAAGVNALGPRLVDEGSGDQVLAISAIEEKIESIAAGLR